LPNETSQSDLCNKDEERSRVGNLPIDLYIDRLATTRSTASPFLCRLGAGNKKTSRTRVCQERVSAHE